MDYIVGEIKFVIIGDSVFYKIDAELIKLYPQIGQQLLTPFKPKDLQLESTKESHMEHTAV